MDVFAVVQKWTLVGRMWDLGLLAREYRGGGEKKAGVWRGRVRRDPERDGGIVEADAGVRPDISNSSLACQFGLQLLLGLDLECNVFPLT